MSGTAGKDISALSDEEIMNMSAPSEAGIEPMTAEERTAALGVSDVTTDDVPAPKTTENVVKGGATDEGTTGSTDGENNGGEEGEGGATTDTPDDADKPGTPEVGQAAGEADNQVPAGDKPAVDAAKDGKTPDASVGGQNSGGQTSEPDYKAVYNQIMAPFKANGKTIELKDPAEAITLMQMGANYTRRMQELAPHRKTLMMLQNNGVDEAKLDYLIALDKRDPAAIKKLIKDSGIDPLEIDTTQDHGFRGGANTVTNEEAAFRTTLEDLKSTEEGRATIIELNRLDDTSKGIVYESPEILTVLHEQRATGVYDTITAEMDRRIALGLIKPSTPFLEAYKLVGDDLVAQAGHAPGAQGHQNQSITPGQAGQPAPVVVTTRVAAPKSTITNSDAASAASSTRSTPTVKTPPQNPLAMSDEDFLKTANLVGRV
jgi:hypothetical protein